MALWDKVKQELDRAGHMAQGAFEEGRLRLDAMRARQLADKAAQAIGYAVYRARQTGTEVETDAYARLSSTLAGHEAEAKRLEERLSEIMGKGTPRRADSRPDTDAPAASPPTSGDAPPGGTAPGAAEGQPSPPAM